MKTKFARLSLLILLASTAAQAQALTCSQLNANIATSGGTTSATAAQTATTNFQQPPQSQLVSAQCMPYGGSTTTAFGGVVVKNSAGGQEWKCTGNLAAKGVWIAAIYCY